LQQAIEEDQEKDPGRDDRGSVAREAVEGILGKGSLGERCSRLGLGVRQGARRRGDQSLLIDCHQDHKTITTLTKLD